MQSVTSTVETLSASTVPSGIVFVSDRIEGAQALVDSLPPTLSVVWLDGSQDGLAQMAAALQGRSGLGAIHVLSHGGVGRVELGSTWLDEAGVLARRDALQAIGEALTPGGDLLLYGCRVGADEQGRSFVQALATATGADVAASDDLTGQGLPGADWVLEVRHGSVDPRTLDGSASAFAGTLAVADENFDGAGLVNVTQASVAVGSWTFEATSTTDIAVALNTDVPLSLNSDGGAGDRALVLNASSLANISDYVIRSTDGSDFQLNTFRLGAAASQADTLNLSAWRDGMLVVANEAVNLGVADSSGNITVTLGGDLSLGNNALLSFNAAFSNIDEIRLSFSAKAAPEIDDIDITAVAPPPSATITSATYDASTGVLAVTASGMTTGDTIDPGKLTLTGRAGATVTLSTAAVTASSATAFSVTLNAADRLAVNGLLNRDGSTAVDGTTFNLAGAANWNTTAAAAADLTGNAVTVSGVTAPTISSATYDVGTQVLSVTGTNLVALVGAGNDIDLSRFTLTGEGGSTVTLSTASVEVSSSTAFSATLNGTDAAALALILNRDGTLSTGGTTFNLAAADNWNSDIANADTSDASNGLTVSNVPTPTLTSATYDASAGVLTVTGTGFSRLSGAGNDIVPGKFSLTGQGGSSYTLTDTGAVDVTSATSFSLTLSSTDRTAVAALLNQNGSSASDSTVYNLAAAEDWAAGAAAGVNLADLTGNGITVSNVTTAPTITSAFFTPSSGLLSITATDLVAGDAIAANKFTLTGVGGASYTLTIASATASSTTLISVGLNMADRLAVGGLLDKMGTSATDGTVFNLAAASGWNTSRVSPADLTGNAVDVGTIPVPVITTANYYANTGQLSVSASRLVGVAGAANDIDVSKLTLRGEGGVTYTLTSPDVDAVTTGSFVVALNATDQAALAQLFNRNGGISTGGTGYILVANEDWIRGTAAATTVADPSSSVGAWNVAVPTISNASYNVQTGVLVVTGTGMAGLTGAANDVVASKFSLTGQGGSSYTLTDTPNVEITSATSFSLTLSATDRSAVNLLMTKTGTSALDATVYNLAAAEDWAAGAHSAVVIADVAGNGITVSGLDNVAPALSTATVNGGNLVLTYTDLSPLDAAAPPAASRFAVTVNGVATSVNSVAVDGAARTVTLALQAPALAGQTVLVSYTDPTAGDDALATQDTAGNDAASFSQQAVTNLTPADVTAPTATVTVSPGLVRSGETATVTMAFSETVNGVGPGVLTSPYGSLSNFQRSSGDVWTATFTPQTDVRATGNVLTLYLSLVRDLSGNAGGEPVQSNTYEVRTREPGSVTLSLAQPVIKALGSTTLTVSFDQPVTGLDAGDFQFSDGAQLRASEPRSSDGGITWQTAITALSSQASSATIGVNLSGITVAGGRAGSGTSAQVKLDIDSNAPTLTIGTTTTTFKPGQATQATFTFSEVPVGFDLSDISVAGVQLSGLQATSNPRVFVADLTAATQPGTVSLAVAPGVYTDTAGNGGAAATWSGEVERPAVLVLDSSRSSPQDDTTNVAADTTFVLAFSQPLDSQTSNLAGVTLRIPGLVNVPLQVSIDAQGRLVIDPAVDLEAGRLYVVNWGANTLKGVGGAVAEAADSVLNQGYSFSVALPTGVTQTTTVIDNRTVTTTTDPESTIIKVNPGPVATTQFVQSGTSTVMVSLPEQVGVSLTTSKQITAPSSEFSTQDSGVFGSNVTQQQKTVFTPDMWDTLGGGRHLTVRHVDFKAAPVDSVDRAHALGQGITPAAPLATADTTDNTRVEQVLKVDMSLPGLSLLAQNFDWVLVSGSGAVTHEGGSATLVGDAAANRLTGGEAADVVAGAAGDDLLDGGAGNDRVLGGAGHDDLVGGSGDDVLQGGLPDGGTWRLVRDAQGQVSARFQPTGADPVTTPEQVFTGPWAAGQPLPLGAAQQLLATLDATRLSDVALLFHAATAQLPSLAQLTAYAGMTQTSAELAQLAVEALVAAHPQTLTQPLAAQVRALAQAVWGAAQVDDPLVQAGVDFISQGGRWADALLYLVRDTRAALALSAGQGQTAGLFSLALPQTLGDTGWKSGSGNDHLMGGDGHDRLIGGDGHDDFDGGAGTDTLVLPGLAADYAVRKALVYGQEKWQVRHNASGDIDTVVNVERVDVDGAVYTWADLAPGQTAAFSLGLADVLVPLVGQATAGG